MLQRISSHENVCKRYRVVLLFCIVSYRIISYRIASYHDVPLGSVYLSRHAQGESERLDSDAVCSCTAWSSAPAL